MGRTWFLGNATKAGGITTSPATGIVFNVTVNSLVFGVFFACSPLLCIDAYSKVTQGYLKVGSQGINHGVASVALLLSFSSIFTDFTPLRIDGYLAVCSLVF